MKKEKIRIAQVCHVFLPHMGGIESETERLHQSLKKEDINTRIITSDLKTPLENRKDYAEYNKTLFSFMNNPFAPGIIKHFIKNEYDIIQVYSAWFLPSFFVTFLRKKARIVTIFPGVYPNKATKKQLFFLRLYKPLAQYVLNKSSKILVQSNSEKEKVLDIFNINPNKVDIMYNGILLEKKIKKINNKEKIILFTGRIIPDKNPDILIKAESILNNQNYKFKIKFIGTIDDNYKKELIELANKLGINKKITFIQNIPLEKRKDLMKEYAESFTCVAVGSWEGVPNRLTEAMQFGIPCVAYNSGGTAELIKDMETGLLINKLDEKELAEKIKVLYNDKNLYKKLGKNAKKIVRDKFNWDKSFDIIYKTYQKVLENEN